MANKTYDYVVVVIPPSEMANTPAKRDTAHINVSATSATRAISKAQKLAATEAGWGRKDYVILEVVIDKGQFEEED